MESTYFLISQSFALAHAGYSKDHLRFGYAITLSGQYVCAANSYNDFPEIFDGDTSMATIPVITLTPEDFPPQPVF